MPRKKKYITPNTPEYVMFSQVARTTIILEKRGRNPIYKFHKIKVNEGFIVPRINDPEKFMKKRMSVYCAKRYWEKQLKAKFQIWTEEDGLHVLRIE